MLLSSIATTAFHTKYYVLWIQRLTHRRHISISSYICCAIAYRRDMDAILLKVKKKKVKTFTIENNWWTLYKDLQLSIFFLFSYENRAGKQNICGSQCSTQCFILHNSSHAWQSIFQRSPQQSSMTLHILSVVVWEKWRLELLR